MIRLAVTVEGVVQGVGFRPFVHAAATACGLAGWVRNRSDGLAAEVEGPEDAVRDFLEVLRRDAPPAARVERLDLASLAPTGDRGFYIVASARAGSVRPMLPADLATCEACAAETMTRGLRRYCYPFTNCTRCGPRYTLIEALPYDRERTAMRRFRLCTACEAEYTDPSDRRFHAEAIACPACGPALRLLASDGEQPAHPEEGRHESVRATTARTLAQGEDALAAAARALTQGRVLALKGMGGFQLLADATDAGAVARLRARKRRGDKPFAVMFPTLAAVGEACALSPEEARVLASPAAPILLVRRRADSGAAVVDGVAPRNPLLGAVLPYTPLHRLLLAIVGRPLVCTSGNLADEPLCTDDEEARARLGTIADLFLLHDRPIVRPVDDSVARVGPAGLEVLRRARGFAPLPLRVEAAEGATVLALGAQLKSTVALAIRGQIIVSQHLGDLHAAEGARLLERTVADLVDFFAARPQLLACDLHPDYVSTRLAERLAAIWRAPLVRVQHHHAHVAACIAEHDLATPVLGLAWDGGGLGADGTLWGSEALVVEGVSCHRVAHLRPFRLPGGERAIREPRRAALGILHDALGPGASAAATDLFAPPERRVLLAMIERGLNAPVTTAMGRLFDAVAALAGIRAAPGFEGQAAMEVECAADGIEAAEPYPLPLGDGTPAIADWRPLVCALLEDRAHNVPPGAVAARFHAALTALAETIALRVGLATVVLTGGCFQNLRLARSVRARLTARGFSVHAPALYPPNDGGIALGQALVALARRRELEHVSRHSG